jgi:hypothetical protein
MTRTPDWRARLARYVSGVARVRFRSGEHDCGMFAAGAIQVMTGEDVAAKFRGYRTIEEGRSAVAAAGFGSMGDYLASIMPEVEPPFAQVGDIVALEENGEEALGVVQGPSIYVLRVDGLGLVPLSRATRAFRP